MQNEELQRRIETLEQQMREHYHDGVLGRQINIQDTIGFIKTVTVVAELTSILASTPTRFTQQILIDTTTGTKKLYIYDIVGHVWRSVTIA